MSESTGPKRTDKQMQRDRLLIANLMLKSYPTREIAEKLRETTKADGYEVSHVTVHKDMKAILEDWREEKNEFIGEMVERELAKLDAIEYEAWKAWQNSQKGRKRKKIIAPVDETPERKETITENSSGDPRYMMLILQCMDKRRELLGLGAAKKVEHSGTIGVYSVQMDQDEINKEKDRMLQNMLKKQGIAYDV